MAECGFSEDGKYFSTITEDGRIKIWDTETDILKQEYTPDLHLTSPPSCLQWLLLSKSMISTKKVKKRRTSESDGENANYIALGTKNGKILLYSLSQAKVDNVLSMSNKNGSISCLDWHRDYGLMSCIDNIVYDWDITSCSVKASYNVTADKHLKSSKVTAIKIIPKTQTCKYLVTASCQLRLWDLKSGTVIRSMVGHSSGVNILRHLHVVAHNKDYIMSGSRNERLLSFWDITPQTNGNADTPELCVTPSYNFVLEDAPRYVSVRQSSVGAPSVWEVQLLAVTRSGVLHYYGRTLNGTCKKPIKPSVTIHVSSEDAEPRPIYCCHLAERDLIIVGYHHTAHICKFKRITPDLKTKTQVIICDSPPTNKKEVSKDNENMECIDNVAYIDTTASVNRKRTSPGANLEVPMESRLANLTIDRSQSLINQNLTKLLIQGLHSKDKELISMVLQKDDMSVALRTCQNLPAMYIPSLLEQLTEMASRTISQCKSVCVWLRALLRCHSAILLATINSPSTADKFMQLVAVLTHKRAHMYQLLNLKGKLDMIVKQRSENDVVDDQAMIDYVDTSSEDEMDLEKLKNSDSDNVSWDGEKNTDSESNPDTDASREDCSDDGA